MIKMVLMLFTEYKISSFLTDVTALNTFKGRERNLFIILLIINYIISSSICTDSNYRTVNDIKNLEVNDHDLKLASKNCSKPYKTFTSISGL
jgi:hypothetical protein